MRPVATAETGQEFVQQLSIMGMPADVNWKVEEHQQASWTGNAT
jgi:hypothetical protein